MRTCNRMAQPVEARGCERNSFPAAEQFPVAMAYVPWQKFETMYEPQRALNVGTIFPELELPFWAGRRNCRR